jgi:hypothetical protein
VISANGNAEVAHEALIRHWPMMRLWVSAFRADLVDRQEVASAARQWVDSGRRPDRLTHRGDPLAKLARLRDHRALRLNASEADYLTACIHRQQTNRRLRTGGILAVILGLAAGVIVFSVLYLQRVQADSARLKAQVDRLADAAPGGVPAILDELAESKDVQVYLRKRYEQQTDRARIRLALALAPVAPEQVVEELVDWMLKEKEPAEVLLVRKTLGPHAAEVKGRLWNKAKDTKAAPAERFRALAALASFDPGRKWLLLSLANC